MELKLKFNPKLFTEAPERLAKNMRFASAVALTRTAVEIKDREVQTMRSVFDRPTPWTLNSLGVKPATKTDLVALVRKREFGASSAGHIIGPHIEGGGSRGKRRFEQAVGGFIVPGENMPLDKYGNVKPATYVKVLSQLKLQKDSTANASKSKRSRSKRIGETYFRQGNIIFVRTSRDRGAGSGRDNFYPAFIITRPPKYRLRFRYFETGQKAFDELFPAQLDRDIGQAIRDAGWK